jgi:predicted Zn-dependent protease
MMRELRVRAGLPVLLLSLLLGAAHAAPATEPLPPNYKPALDSAEGGLWRSFDEFEKEVRLSPLLVKDEALNAHVTKIACDLAGPHCPSLRVYIVNDATSNALCAPNGMILVWTGLLLRAQNEAELAFVLGHEISHYIKRHSLLNFERTRRSAGFLTVLNVATAGLASIGTLIAIGSLASYSRDQEREADADGFELAVARGYDPRQGALFWENVSAEEGANAKRAKPSPYMASHPATKERLATLNKRAAEIESQTQANVVGTDSHRAAIRAYRSAWMDAELNRGEYGESIVMISQLLKAESDSGELHYFLGEAYRRRNDDGDLRQATASYQAAIGAGNAPTAAYRGLGLVALKAGQKDVARDAFAKYLSLAPEANDRAMIQFYLAGVGEAQP